MSSDEKNPTRRRRWTAEQISFLVDKWKASGMSRKKFAQQYGVNHNTFSRWALKGEQKEISRPEESFVKIEIPSPAEALPVMELHSGNKKLVFFSEPSASLLKELLP